MDGHAEGDAEVLRGDHGQGAGVLPEVGMEMPRARSLELRDEVDPAEEMGQGVDPRADALPGAGQDEEEDPEVAERPPQEEPGLAGDEPEPGDGDQVDR